MKSTRKSGGLRPVCVTCCQGHKKLAAHLVSFVTAARLDDVPHFLNIVDSREASTILTCSHSNHGDQQFPLRVSTISVNSVTSTPATFLI